MVVLDPTEDEDEAKREEQIRAKYKKMMEDKVAKQVEEMKKKKAEEQRIKDKEEEEKRKKREKEEELKRKIALEIQKIKELEVKSKEKKKEVKVVSQVIKPMEKKSLKQELEEMRKRQEEQAKMIELEAQKEAERRRKMALEEAERQKKLAEEKRQKAIEAEMKRLMAEEAEKKEMKIREEKRKREEEEKRIAEEIMERRKKEEMRRKEELKKIEEEKMKANEEIKKKLLQEKKERFKPKEEKVEVKVEKKVLKKEGNSLLMRFEQMNQIAKAEEMMLKEKLEKTKKKEHWKKSLVKIAKQVGKFSGSKNKISGSKSKLSGSKGKLDRSRNKINVSRSRLNRSKEMLSSRSKLVRSVQNLKACLEEENVKSKRDMQNFVISNVLYDGEEDVFIRKKDQKEIQEMEMKNKMFQVYKEEMEKYLNLFNDDEVRNQKKVKTKKNMISRRPVKDINGIKDRFENNNEAEVRKVVRNVGKLEKIDFGTEEVKEEKSSYTPVIIDQDAFKRTMNKFEQFKAEEEEREKRKMEIQIRAQKRMAERAEMEKEAEEEEVQSEEEEYLSEDESEVIDEKAEMIKRIQAELEEMKNRERVLNQKYEEHNRRQDVIRRIREEISKVQTKSEKDEESTPKWVQMVQSSTFGTKSHVEDKSENEIEHEDPDKYEDNIQECDGKTYKTFEETVSALLDLLDEESQEKSRFYDKSPKIQTLNPFSKMKSKIEKSLNNDDQKIKVKALDVKVTDGKVKAMRQNLVQNKDENKAINKNVNKVERKIKNMFEKKPDEPAAPLAPVRKKKTIIELPMPEIEKPIQKQSKRWSYQSKNNDITNTYSQKESKVKPEKPIVTQNLNNLEVKLAQFNKSLEERDLEFEKLMKELEGFSNQDTDTDFAKYLELLEDDSGPKYETGSKKKIIGQINLDGFKKKFQEKSLKKDQRKVGKIGKVDFAVKSEEKQRNDVANHGFAESLKKKYENEAKVDDHVDYLGPRKLKLRPGFQSSTNVFVPKQSKVYQEIGQTFSKLRRQTSTPNLETKISKPVEHIKKPSEEEILAKYGIKKPIKVRNYDTNIEDELDTIPSHILKDEILYRKYMKEQIGIESSDEEELKEDLNGSKLGYTREFRSEMDLQSVPGSCKNLRKNFEKENGGGSREVLRRPKKILRDIFGSKEKENKIEMPKEIAKLSKVRQSLWNEDKSKNVVKQFFVGNENVSKMKQNLVQTETPKFKRSQSLCSVRNGDRISNLKTIIEEQSSSHKKTGFSANKFDPERVKDMFEPKFEGRSFNGFKECKRSLNDLISSLEMSKNVFNNEQRKILENELEELKILMKQKYSEMENFDQNCHQNSHNLPQNLGLCSKLKSKIMSNNENQEQKVLEIRKLDTEKLKNIFESKTEVHKEYLGKSLNGKCLNEVIKVLESNQSNPGLSQFQSQIQDELSQLKSIRRSNFDVEERNFVPNRFQVGKLKHSQSLLEVQVQKNSQIYDELEEIRKQRKLNSFDFEQNGNDYGSYHKSELAALSSRNVVKSLNFDQGEQVQNELEKAKKLRMRHSWAIEDQEEPISERARIQLELEALRESRRSSSLSRINHGDPKRPKKQILNDLDQESIEEMRANKAQVKAMFESMAPKYKFGGSGDILGGSKEDLRPKRRTISRPKEERKWVLDTINKYFDVINEEDEENQEIYYPDSDNQDNEDNYDNYKSTSNIRNMLKNVVGKMSGNMGASKEALMGNLKRKLSHQNLGQIE